MFRENKSIIYLYIISHLGIFFITDAIYWDDWEVFNTPKEEIFNMFNQAGSFVPFTPYLHAYLLPIGPWTYRILTFVLFFMITYLFDKIILNSKLVNDETRYVLVLFFTIFPFNIARVALINFPYTVCLTLFFLAWRYKDSRVIALPLFFISFATNSLPFFYIIVMAHFYHEFAKDFKWKTILKFVKSRLDYLLLPVVYFAIKYTFYVPYGDYLGYNRSFSFYNLIVAPIWQGLNDGLFFLTLNVNLFLFSILIFVVYKMLPTIQKGVLLSFERRYLLFFGVISLIIILFPYWILGHVPTFTLWLSRHQLLMPFGMALIFTATYHYIGLKYRRNFLTFIVAISMTINIQYYIDFFRDWNKQIAIINTITREGFENKITFIQDNTFNALSRNIGNYEWEGLIKYTFGKNKNTIIDNISNFKNYKSGMLNSYIKRVAPEMIGREVQFISIDYQEPNRFRENVKQFFYPEIRFSKINLIEAKKERKIENYQKSNN